MIWDGRVRIAVALTDKPAFGSPAHVRETCVANDDALQVLQLITGQRLLPRFANRLPPALDSILRGSLALDNV